MENSNQKILEILLTTDGLGRAVKKENLKIMLNRIKDCSENKDDLDFYIDLIIKEL